VYGSNRGDDSIVVFAADPATGKLTFLQRAPTQGKEPRNFAIDPTGKYLFAANQNSNDITLFKIGADGRLTPTGRKVNAPSPVCIVFTKAE